MRSWLRRLFRRGPAPSRWTYLANVTRVCSESSPPSWGDICDADLVFVTEELPGGRIRKLRVVKSRSFLPANFRRSGGL